MKKKIFSFSAVLLVVLFFGGLSANSVLASTSTNVDFIVSSGADVSTGTESAFTTNDIAKLGTSDDERIQSNGNWPNTGAYDEGKYIEFFFLSTVPTDAVIENVSITNEFYRSGAMEGAKLEVWNGTSFIDQTITTGTSTGADNEHSDTVDVSSVLNTPDKVNNTKIRFLAYRGGTANTKTSHDFIKISVTYSIQEIVIPTPTATLIIRDGEHVIFSNSIELPTAGTIDLNDNTSTLRPINTQSVLSILNQADILSTDFSISNLQYYAPFDPVTDPMILISQVPN